MTPPMLVLCIPALDPTAWWLSRKILGLVPVQGTESIGERVVRLSIVTTMYRSAATIDEFYRRAIEAAEVVSADIELVMVNDGSPDDSLSLALALQAADPRIVIVDLS